MTNHPDIEVNWKRWIREAIDESVKQIHGAQRWINRNNMKYVITEDGKQGLPYPEPSSRKFHRVAVALGSYGKAPRTYGGFGKGFIHTFDEISLDILMKELDTITDFLKYLDRKETFCLCHAADLNMSREEDLLAFYIKNGRSFPIIPEGTEIILTEDLWEEVCESPEYKAKKEADKISYAWDVIIEDISKYVLDDSLTYGSSLEGEQILRIMAREDRFSRRVLAKANIEFMELANQGEVRARHVPSPSGVNYVFLATPKHMNRVERIQELKDRCHVIMGLTNKTNLVVGIATESEIGQGRSWDLALSFPKNWTPEDQARFEYLQNEKGILKNQEQKKIQKMNTLNRAKKNP